MTRDANHSCRLTFHQPTSVADPLFSEISVPAVCPILKVLSD
jgi:hypothetical protein